MNDQVYVTLTSIVLFGVPAVWLFYGYLKFAVSNWKELKQMNFSTFKMWKIPKYKQWCIKSYIKFGIVGLIWLLSTFFVAFSTGYLRKIGYLH